MAPANSFTVTGRCVDDSGKPLAGIDVRLVTCWTEVEAGGRRQVHGSKREPAARAASDADGRFEIGFDPDSPRPVVGASIEAKGLGFAPFLWDGPIADGTVRLDLRDVVLRRGVALSGHVRDANGISIANARVFVQVPNAFGGYSGQASLGTSGVDGSFELEDATPGKIRLTARADDERTSVPADLDVQPGERRSGIEIVMPLYESPLAISGVVLDVDGTPVPRASLNASREKTGQFTGTTNTATRKDGRFRLEGAAGTKFKLHATHPDREATSADLSAVEVGRHDLVLQMVTHPLMRLVVLDEAGRNVPAFEYRITVQSGNSRSSHRNVGMKKTGHDGAAGLAPESDPFEVEVSAEGYETTRTGLLEPDAVPNPIVVRLAQLPGLRGRVTAGGSPVARARVQAMRGPDPSTEFQIDVFRQRIDPRGDIPVTYTDEEGRFALTVGASGPWFVRASKSPLAPMLAGPVEVVAGSPAPELEIQLVAVGSIAGRTRFVSGAAAPDMLVGASCGDGKVLTTISEAEGHYAFGGLSPGGWQVKRLQQALSGSQGSRTGREVSPIEWDCTVTSGGTTVHDLVLPDDAELVVQLDPLLQEPVTWWIDAWDAGMTNNSRADAGPDARSRSLKVPSGRWQTATLMTTQRGRLEWSETFDVLPGKSLRTLGLLPGRIHGRVRLPADPGATVRLTWSRESSLRLEAIADVAADGSFEFPVSVDGTCSIRLEGAARPEARSIDVKPGEQRDIGEL